MYLHTENDAAISKHLKLRTRIENSDISSVVVTDIPIKPQQFPISSF